VKTVAIVQARMSSSRLPGKIMRPVVGKPLLELLVERLKRASRVDEVVIATTTNDGDDQVESLTQRVGIGCFRGSEHDVLDRVLGAAHAAQADVIVEITGDCPLIDFQVIDKLVDVYQANDFDYVANVLKRTYPRGLDTQVFATTVLEEVARLTDDPVDHEHVSLYIYQHPERFKLHNVESGLPEEFWDLRLTVDTAEDFELVRQIYEELYPVNPAFTIHDVVGLFQRRPELRAINQHIVQKAVR
jgi:spore coat polysaccharide biosynthesis protein SpsF